MGISQCAKNQKYLKIRWWTIKLYRLNLKYIKANLGPTNPFLKTNLRKKSLLHTFLNIFYNHRVPRTLIMSSIIPFFPKLVNTRSKKISLQWAAYYFTSGKEEIFSKTKIEETFWWGRNTDIKNTCETKTLH